MGLDEGQKERSDERGSSDMRHCDNRKNQIVGRISAPDVPKKTGKHLIPFPPA